MIVCINEANFGALSRSIGGFWQNRTCCLGLWQRLSDMQDSLGNASFHDGAYQQSYSGPWPSKRKGKLNNWQVHQLHLFRKGE